MTLKPNSKGGQTENRFSRLNTLLFFLLFLAPTCRSSAQTAAPTTSPSPQATPIAKPSPSLERQFFKNILRDQRAIWTSPFHLDSDDAKWLVPLGATTAGLIATDRRTAGALNNDATRLRVSRDISRLGETYTTVGVAAAFYLFGRAQKNARARETGLLAAEAMIDTAIVTGVLKAATQRPRPLNDQGRGRFFTGGNSFPSGHSTNVWSLATVIAYEYGKHRPLVRIGVYGLATAVSISRFTGRNHFLSDVLIGSAIGYGVGRNVYFKHHDASLDGRKGQSPITRSKLFPFIAPTYSRSARSYGLLLAWNF